MSELELHQRQLLNTTQEMYQLPIEVLDNFPQGTSFLDRRIVRPFVTKATLIASGKEPMPIFNPFERTLVVTGPSAVGKSVIAEQSAVYLKQHEELQDSLAKIGRELNFVYLSTGTSLVEASLQRPDLVDLSQWGKFKALAWYATSAVMRYSVAGWKARAIGSQEKAEVAIIDTIAILKQYDIGNSLVAMLAPDKNSSVIQVKFDRKVQKRALEVRDSFWEDNGEKATETARRHKIVFDVDLNQELDRVRYSCGDRKAAQGLTNPRFRRSIIDAMPFYKTHVQQSMIAAGVLTKPIVWVDYQDPYYEYLAEDVYGLSDEQVLRGTNELIDNNEVHAYLSQVDQQLMPFTKISDEDWAKIGMPVPKNIQELREEAIRKLQLS